MADPPGQSDLRMGIRRDGPIYAWGFAGTIQPAVLAAIAGRGGGGRVSEADGPGRSGGCRDTHEKGHDFARADGLLGDNLTTTVQQTEHLSDRPNWDCRECGEPWPCANAKAGLAAEFAGFPSVLAIYMSGQMNDALQDLTAHGESAPRDLYDRFLAWIIR
jgi:hypothetical protein